VNDELPVGLWAEAVLPAIYLKNWLPHAGFKNKKSLYEQMFGEKPQLAHLYPFGTKCYVHIREEKRIGMSKLGPRGMKAYIVAYTESSKVLRLYDSEKRRVFTSRDFKFSDTVK
jgi:hypothetical protein